MTKFNYVPNDPAIDGNAVDGLTHVLKGMGWHAGVIYNGEHYELDGPSACPVPTNAAFNYLLEHGSLNPVDSGAALALTAWVMK